MPHILLAVSFEFAYVLAAQVGHALSFEPGHVATFWPPSGLFSDGSGHHAPSSNGRLISWRPCIERHVRFSESQVDPVLAGHDLCQCVGSNIGGGGLKLQS